MINVFAVKWYGESEFWLALGKVVLAIGLILYTFITMLGGNPLHDRFGFRYWRDPGAFGQAYSTGSLGRFVGFLVCLVQASYTIAGPDYVSMAAGEAENPRAVMPRAYNKVFGRLTVFFVLGSLAVGINVPYNSEEMADAFQQGTPGAAASPYVIAMNRLRIGVLPDIVNALILTACFSAGNSYVYCASRSLYGLALEGRAPRFLTRCMRNGVPIYCVLTVLLISLISFLEVSNGTATVLRWFVNIACGPFVLILRTLRTDRELDHSFPADQLCRRRFHVHPVQESVRCARSVQRYTTIQRAMAAVPRMVRIYRLHYNGVVERLYRLHPRQLGYHHVFLLLHHGWSFSHNILWVEDLETHEDHYAHRGRSPQRC